MILYSIIFLGGVGLLFGIGLGFAAKKFAVKLDPREEEILGLLPGVNCGACGYPGCGGYAAALAAGEAEPGKCSVASSECNKAVAVILGKEAGESLRKVAVILCGGGSKCKDQMNYQGIKDCRAAVTVFGGNKACKWGCLTYGTCVSSCPFGAISQEKDGEVPKIDWGKCTGCGICVSVCPNNLIKLIPCKFDYHVLCKSEDKGIVVRSTCSSGCISCGLCARVCPVKDIVIENNIAVMKYKDCTNCGLCAKKCPTKTIRSFKAEALAKIPAKNK